jgi:S-adenosylmethionine-diacylglycerol 3-amino-3-carboxypropyl transferase
LPLAWREEHFATIRDRLDRLELRQGPIDAVARSGDKVDGFNLSDIFEYMDEATFAAVYGRLIDAATPGARLAYWNMMVPRRLPAAFASRVRGVPDAERRGQAVDKAFFYSDFVVEEVL